jgi:hypothetical protein
MAGGLGTPRARRDERVHILRPRPLYIGKSEARIVFRISALQFLEQSEPRILLKTKELFKNQAKLGCR